MEVREEADGVSREGESVRGGPPTGKVRDGGAAARIPSSRARPESRDHPSATRTRIIVAFAILYVVWGGTFLGMHYAVQTMPPILMAGSRFVIAGAVLYAYARHRGDTALRAIEWRTAAVAGVLLMGGNATVAVAVKRVPSGIAALLIGLAPLWFALLEWARPGGQRPGRPTVIGLALGVLGVGVLVGPTTLIGGDHIDPLYTLLLLTGSVAWVAGSLYSRHAPSAPSPIIMAAGQMVAGGAALLLVALLVGQVTSFSLVDVSMRSWLAFAFLVIFGSLLGYTSYIYLLAVSTPARVSTYAYVNPLVAVFLGWAIAGESVNARVLAAAALILGAVALMTTTRK